MLMVEIAKNGMNLHYPDTRFDGQNGQNGAKLGNEDKKVMNYISYLQYNATDGECLNAQAQILRDKLPPEVLAEVDGLMAKSHSQAIA
jgi:hypothetical protein